MQIEYKPITDLKPSDYNPRKITDWEMQRLIASLEEFGFVDPVIVNSQNEIIGGHQRVEAAKHIGCEEAPCVTVDVGKDKEKTLNLALNKISGDWDEEKLEEVLKSLDQYDQRLAGFSEDELNAILQDIDSAEDDGYETSAPETPKSKQGEIYQLGEHRLLCGDATNREDFAKLMQEETAQMVFTDPPYNVNYEGGGNNEREGIINDKMTASAFYDFLLNSAKNLVEFSEGGIYICMSSSEMPTLKTAFENAGGHWQSFVIWVKSHFTLSGADYQNKYEPIIYGWPSRITNHYFIDKRNICNVWEDIADKNVEKKNGKTYIDVGEYKLELDGDVQGKIVDKEGKTDIWREDKPDRSEEHPTMKPIPLISRAIKNSSKPNEIVLDPFGGSGSTLMAAEQMQRKCYTMELDPRYVDVILDRWEKYTGQKAQKLA